MSELFVSYNAYAYRGYLEDDTPESEPAATVFEDSESEIINYVTDYIAEKDEMPEIDDVAEMFSIKSDADWEALEKYMERERRLTQWNTPLLK